MLSAPGLRRAVTAIRAVETYATAIRSDEFLGYARQSTGDPLRPVTAASQQSQTQQQQQQPFHGPPQVNVTHFSNSGLWQIVLPPMLILLALIAFWPTPVDQPIQSQLARFLQFLHLHGIPAWFTYSYVEAGANVALFLPLGVIGCLAFPDKRWWQVGALGLLVSGCMELGQILFLHDRFASPLDLVTNASGAVIGALLARAIKGTRTSFFRQ